jgi:hypothetical protein
VCFLENGPPKGSSASLVLKIESSGSLAENLPFLEVAFAKLAELQIFSTRVVDEPFGGPFSKKHSFEKSASILQFWKCIFAKCACYEMVAVFVTKVTGWILWVCWVQFVFLMLVVHPP